MSGEPKMPSFEELTEEKKKHMISDAELLKEGAELYLNGTLYPTEQQIEVAKKEIDDKNEFAQVAKNELLPSITEEFEIQKRIDELSSKIKKIEESYTLTSDEHDERTLNEIFNDIKPSLHFSDLEKGDLNDLVSEFSEIFGDNFNKEFFSKRLKIENVRKRQYGEIKEADILFDDKLIMHYRYWDGDESTITGEFHKMFITLALEYGVRKIEKE